MTVHVIGAGLAGLSASIRLAEKGERVALYEAAPQAGGRCRSYEDKALGRVIDNGNHLLLSGNRSALDFLDTIQARDSLTGPNEARYPFFDLKSGERWEVRMGRGRASLLFANPMRSIPGTGWFQRLASLKLAFADEGDTVSGCLGATGPLWERFWDPMATAVLNTPPKKASARLLWAALRESFAKGGRASEPLIARTSLAASLVDPALSFLARRHVDLFFGQRLRAIDITSHAERLYFGNLDVALEPRDHLILALPPSQAVALVPGLKAPLESHAIVNAHFRLTTAVPMKRKSMLLALVGGKAQWLFLRDDMASVTVSAADALAEEDADTIAELLWVEVAKAIGVPTDPMPAYRIVKEKRATFSQTPTEIAKRPPTRTRWHNLHLAGDWIDTGLPATIEGAIRSGERAAEAALGRQGRRNGE